MRRGGAAPRLNQCGGSPEPLIVSSAAGLACVFNGSPWVEGDCGWTCGWLGSGVGTGVMLQRGEELSWILWRLGCGADELSDPVPNLVLPDGCMPLVGDG
jgi:hypothetical protein